MHLLVLNLFWAGCFLQEERKNLKGGLFGLGSKFSHYLVGRVHPTELQKDNILKRCAFRRVGSAHHKKVETVWPKLKPPPFLWMPIATGRFSFEQFLRKKSPAIL